MVVDINIDVQGGLDDVSLEGARKAGVEGVDLGVLARRSVEMMLVWARRHPRTLAFSNPDNTSIVPSR